MKITFDGITIEDAKPKEAIDMIKNIRGKRFKVSDPGVFNLPQEIREGKKVDGRSKRSNYNMNDWTEAEMIYMIKNIDVVPRILAEAPELSSRSKSSIAAKRSAIRVGHRKRMGEVAWRLAHELGLLK